MGSLAPTSHGLFCCFAEASKAAYKQGHTCALLKNLVVFGGILAARVGVHPSKLSAILLGRQPRHIELSLTVHGHSLRLLLIRSGELLKNMCSAPTGSCLAPAASSIALSHFEGGLQQSTHLAPLPACCASSVEVQTPMAQMCMPGMCIACFPRRQIGIACSQLSDAMHGTAHACNHATSYLSQAERLNTEECLYACSVLLEHNMPPPPTDLCPDRLWIEIFVLEHNTSAPQQCVSSTRQHHFWRTLHLDL